VSARSRYSAAFCPRVEVAKEENNASRELLKRKKRAFFMVAKKQ